MKRNNILGSVIILAIILAVGYFALGIGKKDLKKVEDPSNQDQRIEETLANKSEAINGLMVDPEKVSRPYAVVVENHPDARPQSGLSQADIVYESLAEGGITRYLAIFQTQDVKAIGPVRSARTYFNDWAQELGAIYTHVGGNTDALDYVKKGIPGVSDLDEFYYGDYFNRITSRRAPHNTYISTASISKNAKDRGFKLQPTYSPLSFKDEPKSEQTLQAAAPNAATINIDFSLPSFAVKWAYDRNTNSYKRYLAGNPVVDAGNGQSIMAKTVIIQRVRNWEAHPGDPKLVLSMATREGGSAQVFMDGNETKGTWKQLNGRTKFFDLQSKEIKLNRGQIWIEILPPDNSVTVSK